MPPSERIEASTRAEVVNRAIDPVTGHFAVPVESVTEWLLVGVRALAALPHGIYRCPRCIGVGWCHRESICDLCRGNGRFKVGATGALTEGWRGSVDRMEGGFHHAVVDEVRP